MSTVVVSPFATSQTIEQTVVDVAVETKPTYAVVESSGVQVNVTPDETVVQVAPVDVNVNVDPNVFYVQICTCDLYTKDALLTPEVKKALQDIVNTDSVLASIEDSIALYQNAVYAVALARQQQKLAIAQLTGDYATYELMKYSNAGMVRLEETIETVNSAISNRVDLMMAMIGDPENPGEGSVYAAIINEQTARATRDSALAQQIDVMLAVIGDPTDPDVNTIWAAIKDGQAATATLEEALAVQRTELLAIIDTNDTYARSQIVLEQQARASADSALASSVSTLTTTLNGHTTTISVLTESVDGIEGKHGVTIDANGYETGWELIGGTTSGGAKFNVDYFYVGKQSATGIYPFAIGTVNGVTMTTIQGAYIDDLTIGRIALAGAATCSLSWGNANGNYWTTSGGLGLVYPSWNIPSGGSITLDVTGADHVIVIGFIRCITSGTLNYGKLMKGTSQLFYMGESGSETSLHGIALDSSPGTGAKTYSVQVYNPSAPSGGAVSLYAVGIMAIAFYR